MIPAYVNGYIAMQASGPYRHFWGGDLFEKAGALTDDWTVLITLDLNDSRLRVISAKHRCLPLPTVLNSDAVDAIQTYEFDSEQRIVRQVERRSQSTSVDPEDAFRLPLEQRHFDLRPMQPFENPLSDDPDACSEAIDSFIGAQSFIRLLGRPLWMQYAEQHDCRCARPMTYIASVGYERYNEPAGWISDRPFFWGEGALYFFYCDDCSRVLVSCQST